MRRAFTILEMVIILVVLGVLSLIGLGQFDEILDRSGGVAADVRLATIQTSVRGQLVDGDFPSTISVPGVTTASSSSSSDVLSWSRPRPGVALYALSDGVACHVLVDRLGAKEGWGIQNSSTCSATSFDESVILGSNSSPTEL